MRGPAGGFPTEAEWEYAAGGASAEPRYGPVDVIAGYANNSGRAQLDGAAVVRDPKAAAIPELNGNRMHAVAAKRPDGFGLYDMLGNVWEWVSDWSAADY